MTDDKFDSDINFNKVLFMHLNRIAMSETSDQMNSRVDIYESLLCPYIDEDYENELKPIKTTFEHDCKMAQQTHKADPNNDALVKATFRALMKLAERKNLLLEKEGEGIDPGDTDEGYDTPNE